MGHLFYLFARPSFISGMASVLDIGGNNVNYNLSQTPEEADNAIKSDWYIVGKDISDTIEKEKRNIHAKKEETK